MKVILHRRCRNGVKEIQIFKTVSANSVIHSLWLEGDNRAVLESINMINEDQAETIQRVSIHADWNVVGARTPIE
jgi:hypothetical protein